jgi:CRP-like cAMP-binding protein
MAARAEETAALLGRVPVFEALRPEDLERVADVAVPRSFRGGEVVFRENDDSDTCYVVRSGHARAVREHADGRQIALATFGPGDIFGELAMFDDERRSATVEAVDALDVMGIPGVDMRALLTRHPDRFLAVLERAGVISQGRGRLTVHDPAALSGYVY